MTLKNNQIHLVSRPDGELDHSNFELVESAIPRPSEGQVLLKTLYLSLDPYMRSRMYDGKNYTAGTPLNAPMVGTSLSQVLTSRHPDYGEGDFVIANYGWQEFSLSDGTGLVPVSADLEPKYLALSTLGLPGHTAYGALLRLGHMKPGETLLVSAASGAVGSVAVQIGKLKGLNVVGLAGGPEKCAYITSDLGADHAIDRRAPDVLDQLKATCADGIDIYFDNVSGPMAEGIIDLMADYGRYLVCGTIAINRDVGFGPGTDNLQKVLATILVKRLTIRGFIFGDFLDMADNFRTEMMGWINAGDVKSRNDIIDGIENAPKAFLGLFSGQNFGKLLVRMGEG
ncbi:MAG: NADP-dependent oxidoreductase [Pseudomonadota bacterium]